jgi:hypothetical protein
MSLIAMAGGATGTGTVTLLAPITNTDRTLTLPDVTDTVAGIAATQTLTNKTLTSPTLTTPNIDSAQFATVSGTAPLYACRAWVNFNGTGTPAIRGSGNVSSITDNGTGDYTVNFTTAMSDVNYQPTFGTGDPSLGGAWDYVAGTYQIATTYIRMRTYGAPGGAVADSPSTGVAIFR